MQTSITKGAKVGVNDGGGVADHDSEGLQTPKFNRFKTQVPTFALSPLSSLPSPVSMVKLIGKAEKDRMAHADVTSQGIASNVKLSNSK